MMPDKPYQQPLDCYCSQKGAACPGAECVVYQGLAEQLLNVVVKHERADLEEQRESLIQQMSSNKVLLSNLEESLLSNLSNASGNILDNQVTANCLSSSPPAFPTCKSKH